MDGLPQLVLDAIRVETLWPLVLEPSVRLGGPVDVAAPLGVLELVVLDVGAQLVQPGQQAVRREEGHAVLERRDYLDLAAAALQRRPVGRRLLVRQRLSYPQGLGVALMWHLVEPVAFVMERQMLLGIKSRAEGSG